jgi:hypothetical protein
MIDRYEMETRIEAKIIAEQAGISEYDIVDFRQPVAEKAPQEEAIAA